MIHSHARAIAGALILGTATLLVGPLEAAPPVELLESSEPLEDAWFGHAVAVDGDRLVVGVPRDDTIGSGAGLVTVFERTVDGWVERARVGALDVEANDSFGWSVDLDGDLMAVGAPGDDDRAGSAGAVYVLRLVEGRWTEVTKLTAADGAQDDNFGSGVGISGDTVAVGARSDDDLGNAAGSVYVYRDGGSGYALEQHLFAVDGHELANLGESIALDGDTIVAGAPTATSTGAAVVWKRLVTTWTERARLTPPVAVSGDRVGNAVSVHGDTVVIGAKEHDGFGSVRGVAFAYRDGDNGWQLEQQLSAPDGADLDVFGYAVAVGEDVAVIGAPGDDHPAEDDSGSAYVFTRDGTVWTFDRKLTAGTPSSLDLFGGAVAVAADVFAVGSPFDDDGADDAGTVTIFDGRDPPPPPPPATEVDGFVLPARVSLDLPAGKSKGPSGLTLKGTLDTGGSPVNLQAPTTVTIGQVAIELPPPFVFKRGKALRHAADGLELTLTPDKHNSSRVGLSLSLHPDQAAEAGILDDLEVRFATGALDARTTVRLDDGTFRPGKAGALLDPPVLPTSVKAKLRGGGRDSVKITATYSGDAPAGDVCVTIGDTVDLAIPVSAFKEKKGRLDFRGDGPGVARLTLDPAKGRISVNLANVDLGPVPDEPVVPLLIGIDLGDDALPVVLRLRRKKTTLRY